MSRISRTIIRLLILLACLSLLAACVPVPAPAPSNSITGIVWQWVSVTNQTTKQTTTVPTPESYTIVFNADGTLAGKADCNSFTGTYSQENGFTIKLGATTMMYCGDASLDATVLAVVEQCRGRWTGWRGRSGPGDGGRRTADALQKRRPGAEAYDNA